VQLSVVFLAQAIEPSISLSSFLLPHTFCLIRSLRSGSNAMAPKTLFVFVFVSFGSASIQAFAMDAGLQACPAGDSECKNTGFPSIALRDISLLQHKGQLKRGTERFADTSDGRETKIHVASEDKNNHDDDSSEDVDGFPPYICLYRSTEGRGVLPGAMGNGQMMLKYIEQESSTLGDLGKLIKAELIKQSAAVGASVGLALALAVPNPFITPAIAIKGGAKLGAQLGPSIINHIPGLGTALHSYAVFDSKGKQISTLGKEAPTEQEASQYIARLQEPPPIAFKVWYRSNFWGRKATLGKQGDWSESSKYLGDNDDGIHAYTITTADNKIIYTTGWFTPREDEM